MVLGDLVGGQLGGDAGRRASPGSWRSASHIERPARGLAASSAVAASATSNCTHCMCDSGRSVDGMTRPPGVVDEGVERGLGDAQRQPAEADADRVRRRRVGRAAASVGAQQRCGRG